MASLSNLIGGSAPVGSIVQGQFAGDPTFLPCDGSDQIAASYPLLDKTDLATFGANVTTLRAMPASAYWGPTAYGNGVYLCIPAGNAGTASVFATSTDGITWVSRTPPVAGTYWYNLIFAAGLFVATNYLNQIYTSPDGVNWTLRFTSGTSLSTYMQTLAYGNGMFVIPCGSQTFAYCTSPDGLTWTLRNNFPSNAYTLTANSFAGGKFRIPASESASVVYASVDGINWSIPGNVAGGSGTRYLDVGSTLVSSAGYRSFDKGNTWVADASMVGAFLYVGGWVISTAGYFQPAYGGAVLGGWRVAPSQAYGTSTACACVVGNRVILPIAATSTSIQTVDFDSSKFRTPIANRVADTDRYYIKAK